MEKQFTTPVSMKVTEQQFKNDLEQPLLEMGYKINNLTSFKSFPIIINNFESKLGWVSNIYNTDKLNYNRYLIKTYNPKLFLALAGMTNSPDGNVGEWRKCNGTMFCFDDGKLYKQIGNDKNYFILLDRYGNTHHLCNNIIYKFPKATKEEIISFFSEKETETEVEQELIGYRFRNDDFNRMACILSATPDMYNTIRDQGYHIYRTWVIVDKLKELNILETFCEPVYYQQETPISYEEAIEKLNENSKVKYTKKA